MLALSLIQLLYTTTKNFMPSKITLPTALIANYDLWREYALRRIPRPLVTCNDGGGTLWIKRLDFQKLSNVTCCMKVDSLLVQIFYKHFECRSTNIFYLNFGPKTSSFQLPYQRHSSSANCARELLNGSNGLAILLVCTWKKFLVGVADFVWATS